MQNPENHLTDISTFMVLDIRVGKIIKAEKNVTLGTRML
ncbi:hypothetical protein XCR1_880007 [Xenorhabdus cabanillasii JM26]|uniref:Uncharacterized protein n=1 Tax=Xenorhabdus cabanillasii JM26 TaxID=1427517 RepID=W1J9A4_9GAMM|nr:hypothetical protein XCR1_880007 [Xenorhabdus cabanillasii JM26]